MQVSKSGSDLQPKRKSGGGKMAIFSHLCLRVTHSQVGFSSGSSLSKCYFNREIIIPVSLLFDRCNTGTVTSVLHSEPLWNKRSYFSHEGRLRFSALYKVILCKTTWRQPPKGGPQRTPPPLIKISILSWYNILNSQLDLELYIELLGCRCSLFHLSIHLHWNRLSDAQCGHTTAACGHWLSEFGQFWLPLLKKKPTT